MTRCTLLLVGCLLLAAQNTNDYLTGSMFNGRWWVAFSEEHRLTYVLGIRDGLNVVAANPQYFPGGKSALDAYRAKRFDTRDVVAVIDAIYKERENVRIPVAMAFDLANEKLKGDMTTPQYEERLRQLRRLSTEY